MNKFTFARWFKNFKNTNKWKMTKNIQSLTD